MWVKTSTCQSISTVIPRSQEGLSLERLIQSIPKIIGSCVLKVSMVECRLIPLISLLSDTLVDT